MTPGVARILMTRTPGWLWRRLPERLKLRIVDAWLWPYCERAGLNP